MRTVWLALNISGHQIAAVGRTVTDWVGVYMQTSHSLCVQPCTPSYAERTPRDGSMQTLISLCESSMVGGLGVSCSYEGTLPRRCRHLALASSSPSRAGT